MNTMQWYFTSHHYLTCPYLVSVAPRLSIYLDSDHPPSIRGERGQHLYSYNSYFNISIYYYGIFNIKTVNEAKLQSTVKKKLQHTIFLVKFLFLFSSSRLLVVLCPNSWSIKLHTKILSEGGESTAVWITVPICNNIKHSVYINKIGIYLNHCICHWNKYVLLRKHNPDPFMLRCFVIFLFIPVYVISF